MDDYIDEFSELINEAGYIEGLSIVMKFRKGLDRKVQDWIAEMGQGRPVDDDPEGWYEAACLLDANWMVNQAFCRVQHAATPVLVTCRWCSEPKHLVEECPKMYDVHYVTPDNREDWIGCLHLEESTAATGVLTETLETPDSPPKQLEGTDNGFTPC